jgi:hypothetical protein
LPENVEMISDPDQVHVHHGVAATVVREEVHAEVAVQAQQRQRHRQHREGGHDQHVGAQHGPGEHRHAHQGHARGAHLEDGHEEVHAGQQRAQA